MSRDYEQMALELVGRWTIACPPEHPLWNHRRMAIAAALRAERLATLREAREAANAQQERFGAEYDARESGADIKELNTLLAQRLGALCVREAIDRLIAEKESETDG